MSMFGDFARSQTIVREKTMVSQSAAKEKLAGNLVKKKDALFIALLNIFWGFESGESETCINKGIPLFPIVPRV